jgi:hypothetical protein
LPTRLGPPGGVGRAKVGRGSAAAGVKVRTRRGKAGRGHVKVRRDGQFVSAPSLPDPRRVVCRPQGDP